MKSKRPRSNRRGKESSSKSAFGKPKFSPTKLRIVSGTHRNRKVGYNGDPATRPMKEKTREAVFSLLGGKFSDHFAIDLFGGTGILAIETVSRGAAHGIVLELARPAVTGVIENLEVLDLKDRIQVFNVDTLRWLRDFENNLTTEKLSEHFRSPWVVFACPPYKLWKAEEEKMTEGIETLYRLAPAGSRIVCETDDSFQIQDALTELEWDVRKYPPATIAIVEK